ncbi:hypothetical protein KLP28_14225 [Nocardioidaceae bacterium]|nr:hypothetical protein KLP28_14225 [Nocardioidaceae bacterium]
MSPFSPQVVAAATLLTGPVFYQSLVARTAPLDVALTRFLIIWVVTWVVVSLVVDLLFPTRLETERRVRDLLLAEREVRKALQEAEQNEQSEQSEAGEQSSAPPVPAPREAPTAEGQARDDAASIGRTTP